MTQVPQVRLSGVEKIFATPGRPGRAIKALGPIDLALRQGEFYGAAA